MTPIEPNRIVYLLSTELPNLGAMSFDPGPQVLSPRHGCAAVVFDAHRGRVIGGGGGLGSYLATTEVLETRTMTFAPGPACNRSGLDVRLCYCQKSVACSLSMGTTGRLATP